MQVLVVTIGKKIKYFTILLLLSFTMLAYAGERLSNAELKEFYTNKTLKIIHYKLGSGMAYYGADGTVRNIVDSGKERTGKWWIDESENMRCVRWNDDDKDRCNITEKDEDGTYTLIDRKSGKKIVEFVSSTPGNQLK